jgi:hypothetical protein
VADLGGLVRAAVLTAMQERDLFDRLNPCARSQHSDSTSAHSPPATMPLPSREERCDFKLRVAAFYGLAAADGGGGQITDMFGVAGPTADVTLAHIWPASYTNWEEPAREPSLPIGFHTEPRNFMLLPRDVHAAFDRGDVVFIPTTTGVTCFVLPAATVSDGVRRLSGRALHLPLQVTPYKRLLAYFARCATRHGPTLDAGVQAALEASMSASAADDVGNAALQDLMSRMESSGVVGTVCAGTAAPA